MRKVDPLTNKKYWDTSQFSGNRELVVQRDGEKCVKCGMTRVEHKARFGRDISVDHIDGRGCNTPSAERNNDPANLQTLCLPCHGKKDVLRRAIRAPWRHKVNHIELRRKKEEQ